VQLSLHELTDQLKKDWGNNTLTTMVWELISNNQLAELQNLIMENPTMAHLRNEDGPGPMW